MVPADETVAAGGGLERLTPGIRERAVRMVRAWRRMTDDVAQGIDSLVLWFMGANRRRLLIEPVSQGYALYLRELPRNRRRNKPTSRFMGMLPVFEGGYMQDGPVLERLERVLASGCRVVALMPQDPEHVIVRTVSFSTTATRRLDKVMADEIERIAPYPGETTAYDYRLEGHRIEDGKVGVRIAIARRESVDQFCKELAELGLEPDVVTPGEGGVAQPFNLLDKDHRAAERAHIVTGPKRRTVAAFGAALIAFLMINLVGRLVVWGYLATTIDDARTRAETAAALKVQAEALSGYAPMVTARKERTVPVVALVDALSRSLPDQTSLTVLRVRGETAEIQGHTPDPAALLTPLSRIAMLEKPTLAASDPHDGDARDRRFLIRARIADHEPPWRVGS